MSNNTLKDTQTKSTLSAAATQAGVQQSDTPESPPTMSDSEKKSSREFTSILLALQFGALLLTPSIKGFINPPYVNYGWLLAYYLVALCSIIMLGMIFYITFMPNAKQPVKREGISTHLWWISLVCFLIFFGTNIVSDHRQPPSIEDITISDMTPNTGELIKLTAKIKAPQSSNTSIEWKVNTKLHSTKSYLFYNVQPDDLAIVVKLTVANNNGDTTCFLNIPVFNKLKGDDDAQKNIVARTAELKAKATLAIKNTCN
jgi:hypothetical protein